MIGWNEMRAGDLLAPLRKWRGGDDIVSLSLKIEARPFISVLLGCSMNLVLR